MQLDQAGKSVTGTATFDGHPCFAACAVVCKAKGKALSGWFEEGPLRMAFHGSCWGHDNSEMSASYEVHDGPCAGERGTIRMTRIAGGGPGAPEADGAYVGEIFLIDAQEGDVTRLSVFERGEREP